jgi:hypothetical protein
MHHPLLAIPKVEVFTACAFVVFYPVRDCFKLLALRVLLATVASVIYALAFV